MSAKRFVDAEHILRRSGLLNFGMDHGINHVAGHRCYAMIGDLARLENVLMKWTMRQLVTKFGFKPVVVPNLVYDDVVLKCGFDPHGDRTQVYSIDGNRSGGRSVCLSGTGEVPLVSLHMGTTFDDSDLPKRYCTTSRCFRAETSQREPGLYRVHYFKKVEMLSLVRKGESESTLKEFVEIQKNLFTSLGLENVKIIDMPPEELGASASRKFDIEYFYPGKKMWGEISSASDCREYQSRNFNIKYRFVPSEDDNSHSDRSSASTLPSAEPFREEFVSSVNGTGAASPRLLLALIESHQERTDGSRIRVRIPEVLRPDMNGQQYLNVL